MRVCEFIMIRAAALLAGLFLVLPAHAQQAVLSAPSWTVNQPAMYTGQSSSQPVVRSAGPAGGGAVGLGMSEILQVNRGTGSAPYANTGTGPLSTHNCSYDGPTTGAYHWLCWDADAQGGSLIAIGSGGGATPFALNFNINGSNYPFPGTGNGNIVGPSPSVVNNVATFNNTTGTLLKDSLVNLSQGNQTPVAGVSMKVNSLTGNNTYDVTNLAAIWPAGTTECQFCISQTFTASGSSTDAPRMGLLSFVNNSNATQDVVAIIGTGNARTNNGAVYGANLLVLNGAGTTGTKLIGLEIDVAPTIGTTVSGSTGGIFMNAFNVASLGPVLQTNGITGGTWSNGIQLGGIAAAGSGLFIDNTYATKIVALVNAVSGPGYTDSAIKIGNYNSNGQQISWAANSGTNAVIRYTTTNDWSIIRGSDSIVITSAGLIDLKPSGGAINFGPNNDNYFVASNAATGNSPGLAATGLDAAINANIFAKGAGAVDLYSNTKLAVEVYNTSSAVTRNLVLQGSTTNPSIDVSAGSLSIVPNTIFAGHLTVEGVTSSGATGTGNFVFATAPTITTLTVSSGGAAIVGNSSVTGTLTATGHVITGSSSPALTTCGTSPAIAGSDTAGEVIMGTGAPTGCVITFASAYTSAPLCTVTWYATPLASQSYAVSTTAITLTQTGTSSNKAAYHCIARSGG